ncbi:hypothetical protein X946_2428 [Burkholderia sp. ABCPW 111]|nr:hypothetical protein X946_2428 [Burkholderia sp. ABCPW 111]
MGSRRYGDSALRASASIGWPFSCSSFSLRDIHCALCEIIVLATRWDRYNRGWHLEKLGFKSPLEACQEQLMKLAA